MVWSVVESSDGERKVSMRLLQSLLCSEKGKFYHDAILTIMNISIAILNYFIANITLMLLTTLVEILKKDLIEQIILRDYLKG